MFEPLSLNTHCIFWLFLSSPTCLILKDLHPSTFKIGQHIFRIGRSLNRLLFPSLKVQTSTPFHRHWSRQMNTSPSFNPALWSRHAVLNLSLSQLCLTSSSLGTLRSKARRDVDAEAVLVAFDDPVRRDDLLLVVEDDWLSLPAHLHHLHLAGVGVGGIGLRPERLEPAGVQLLPFDLTPALTIGHLTPALAIGHQLWSW